MDRIEPRIPGITVADSAFNAWAAALAVASMLFFAPAGSADELICEVPDNGSPARYLINIDDRRSTVTVVSADTNKPYQ